MELIIEMKKEYYITIYIYIYVSVYKTAYRVNNEVID